MSRKLDRWEKILHHLKRDVSKPVNLLTATEIKIATRDLGGQEEPRIMASMDSEGALPDFFRKHGVFLLPLARGKYALVHGNGFHALEPPKREERFSIRLPLDMTSLEYGHGESRYLFHALHAGLISHFSGVSQLYPTIMGKMGTADFSFSVSKSIQLDVSGAGMEVDLGLEGPNDILLFEAKVQPRSTFLIRQLYYPFRTFSKVSTKSVRSFFFVAEPGASLYTMWEYGWTDPTDYGSIYLKDSASFELEDSRLPTEALEEIDPDPALAIVPQANKFQFVEEFPSLVRRGVVDARSWAAEKGYVVRQGDYYSEAAESLGLIRRERDPKSRAFHFVLAEAGRRLLATPPHQREELLAHLLLRNPLMNAVYRLALQRQERGVTRQDIERLIREYSDLRTGTPGRRSQTVRAYFRWLSKVTDAVIVDSRLILAREGADRLSTSNARAWGQKKL